MNQSLSKSLECRQFKAPLTPEELESMARTAWRRDGILVVRPEQIVNDWDRQHVVNIATKIYGKRIEAEGAR